MLRAVHIVTTNLERIADFAVNIVGQLDYYSDPAFIKRYEYEGMFKEVMSGLSMVYKALSSNDLALAFKICRTEFHLDNLYESQFNRLMVELRSGTDTQNLITTVFILRYLERMGDSLLNIGEAIIYSIVGERFKIHQFQALKETLEASGIEMPISDVEFQSIWGTRSGCRIGKVGGDESKDQPYQGAIFKEGKLKKLQMEKDNIERWERLMPGLPPKIYGFQKDNGNASILLQYLGGCTFQEVVLNTEPSILENAYFLIEQTVGAMWRETLKKQETNARFMSQLAARLPEVYHLHPSYDTPEMSIGQEGIESFEDLVQRARDIEPEISAPFTVFIHGDFNINNIVYNHEDQRIHYIDLHRSRDFDYVQDVSVFLVSNFRLPVFDRDLRSRLEWVIISLYRFAHSFAREHDDETFSARMALALARSLITSTRFELNRNFARQMYLRGVYLLRRLVAHYKKPWRDFTLPEQIFRY